MAPAPQIKIKINIKASEAAKNSSVKRVPQKKKKQELQTDKCFLTIVGVKQFTAQIKINNRYADKSMELVAKSYVLYRMNTSPLSLFSTPNNVC